MVSGSARGPAARGRVVVLSRQAHALSPVQLAALSARWSRAGRHHETGAPCARRLGQQCAPTVPLCSSRCYTLPRRSRRCLPVQVLTVRPCRPFQQRNCNAAARAAAHAACVHGMRGVRCVRSCAARAARAARTEACAAAQCELRAHAIARTQEQREQPQIEVRDVRLYRRAGTQLRQQQRAARRRAARGGDPRRVAAAAQRCSVAR